MNSTSPAQSGYIALVSTIIISAVLLILMFGSSTAGFISRFNLVDAEFKEQSEQLAWACVETALLKLTEGLTYAGDEFIPVGSGQCWIKSVALTPPTIEAQASSSRAWTNLRVQFNPTTPPTVVSWQELPNF